MASILSKGIAWLGLGPHEYYQDYEDQPRDDGDFYEPPTLISAPTVRTVPSRPVVIGPEPDEDDEPAGIRVLPSQGQAAPGPTKVTDAQRTRSVVRPLPASATPKVVAPQAFNDAQEVGDLFKRHLPVIMNLSGLERDLARRLLDFASGVTYGLGGKVEHAGPHVYLLSPADVEVSDEQRRRIRDGSFADER